MIINNPIYNKIDTSSLAKEATLEAIRSDIRIQRGYVAYQTLSAGPADPLTGLTYYLDITIESINPAKSFVLLNTREGQDTAIYPVGYLLNSTTLRLFDAYDSGSMRIEKVFWQVVSLGT